MFRRLRAAIRLLGMIVVTAAASAPPALLRLVLGAEHPRTVRLGSRCSRVWGAGMCRVMGIRRRVEGAPGEPPFVVAANHVSYLDIIVLSSV